MEVAHLQNSDYLFLVGKVRVFENKLFDRGRFRRLIETGSRERFIKELSDTKYRLSAERIKNDDNRSNFIIACDGYLYEVYRNFKNKVEDSSFLDIFMLESDIADFVDFARGAECKESYCRGVLNINWAEAEDLSGFFKEAQNKIEKIQSGASLNEISYFLIEKVCMDMITEKYLKNVQSPALREYRRYYIDTKNLLAKANMNVNDSFLRGGNIDTHFWKRVNISDGIPRKIKSQPYMQNIKSTGNRNLWEPEIRRFLSGLLKNMRKHTFGPEAVTAYMLSIKEEIKNLSLIYTGLGMGLGEDLIKDNLNLAYV